MALAANAAILPRHVAGSPKFEGTYGATGADEYYMGAIVCEVAGKAILTNADGVTTLGIHMDRVSTAAADDPVRINIRGFWWIAAAGCADGTLGDLMSPLVTSDNPADIVKQAITEPFALGSLIHVDVTGTSGTIDLGNRGMTNA